MEKRRYTRDEVESMMSSGDWVTLPESVMCGEVGRRLVQAALVLAVQIDTDPNGDPIKLLRLCATARLFIRDVYEQMVNGAEPMTNPFAGESPVAFVVCKRESEFATVPEGAMRMPCSRCGQCCLTTKSSVQRVSEGATPVCWQCLDPDEIRGGVLMLEPEQAAMVAALMGEKPPNPN